MIVSVFENKLDRDQVYYLVSSKTVAWGSQTVVIVVSWYDGKNRQKPLYFLARTIQNHGFLWIYSHLIHPFMIIFFDEIHLFHQEYPILIVIIHFVLVITCHMFLNISYNLQSPICVGHYGLHPFSQRPLRSPRQTGWSVLDVEEATAGNFPRPDPDLNAPDLV